MRPLRIEPLESRCVPTTITPTTFADGGPGSGSLRDAVLQFNADPGTEDDIIQLLAGTYTLSIRNTGMRQENAALQGDLDITSTAHRLIIQGQGPSTVIDAGQLQDRVFQIVNPGTRVVFRGVVIRGGLAQDDGSAGTLAGTTDAQGGGIHDFGGDVTLDNVAVTNNLARGGNGAHGPGGGDGYNAQGGGFYSNGGLLRTVASRIANNQAVGGQGGGGVYFGYGGFGGAGQGGGLHTLGGTLDISGSTIASNQAIGGQGGDGASYGSAFWGPGGQGGAGQGGGLYSNGALLTLTNATLSANTVLGGAGGRGSDCPRFCIAGSGGPGGSGQGGSVYGSGTMLTLTNTTLSSNTARGGNGGSGGAGLSSGVDGNGGQGNTGQGGGLYSNGGMLTLSNATISANMVRSGDGGRGGGGFGRGGNGGAGLGGGIDIGPGTFKITHTTVAANTAEASNGGVPLGNPGTGQGGGVRNNGGTVSIRNTLFGNNTATSHPDVSGAFASAFYNLVRDGTGSNLLNGVNGNLVGSTGAPLDPRLGPLADNGGPTQTHALLSGSPALDAGDPAAGTTLTFPKWDQRGQGFSRIVDGRLDIGAFEAQTRAASGQTLTAEAGGALEVDLAVLVLLESRSRRNSLCPAAG